MPEVTLDQPAQMVRVRGPVKVEWGPARLTAAAADFRSSENVFCLFGPVEIDYNNLIARGEKMTFNPDTEELTLTGHPVVAERNGEVFKGEQMQISLKDNQLRLKKIGQLQINLEQR